MQVATIFYWIISVSSVSPFKDHTRDIYDHDRSRVNEIYTFWRRSYLDQVCCIMWIIFIGRSSSIQGADKGWRLYRSGIFNDLTFTWLVDKKLYVTFLCLDFHKECSRIVCQIVSEYGELYKIVLGGNFLG